MKILLLTKIKKQGKRKRKENNIYINDNNTEFIDDIFINAVRKQTI